MSMKKCSLCAVFLIGDLYNRKQPGSGCVFDINMYYRSAHLSEARRESGVGARNIKAG